ISLSALHLPTLGWLADARWSKPGMLIMILWTIVGQTMVIMLAGLQDVPQHLYEAADLDGANAWQKLVHVTVPTMSPVIFYNLITGVIFFLQFFTQAYVATSANLGAPDNSTLFYALYIYQHAVQYLQMGYAAAVSWILLLATL